MAHAVTPDQARTQLNALLDQAVRDKERIPLEIGGSIRAYIVPAEDVQALEEFESIEAAEEMEDVKAIEEFEAGRKAGSLELTSWEEVQRENGLG